MLYRKTVCWKCHADIDSNSGPECHRCRWIICPNCGSCYQYGCFGACADYLEQRNMLRRMHFERQIPHDVSLHEWCVSVFAECEELIAKEEADRVAAIRARNAIVALQKERERQAKENALLSLREKYCVGKSVVRKDGMIGSVIGYTSVDGSERILVSFGGKELVYVFPDAFEKGFLT